MQIHISILSSLLALLGVLLLSVSCGTPMGADMIYESTSSIRQYHVTNEDLIPYVNRFKEKYLEHGGALVVKIEDIPVNFGDTGTKVGVCLIYTNGEREVLVDLAWWDNQSSRRRELLIFHELGHCALGRDHQDRKVEGSDYSSSIMNSVLMSERHYQKFLSPYQFELFTWNGDTLEGAVLKELGVDNPQE
jgi:hypothetical protein